MASADVYREISELSNEEWLDVLLNSINNNSFKQIQLPGFPSEEIQKNFVGTVGESTVREAYNFYVVMKSYCNSHRKLDSNSEILDFGCGWGRIARFFLKDTLPDNIYGVDVDDDIVKTCKEIMGYGTFNAIKPFPPFDVPDNKYDLIYAYSVFSHLSEEAHIKWIEEFARVLKPGGLLIVTTQGKSFIEFCASFRPKLSIIDSIKKMLGSYELTYDHPWHKALANSFTDKNKALRDYDEGNFLFSATGGGAFRPSTFYGEAIIPPNYVKNNWTKYLSFIDFVDDRNFLPQALIVMQKP